ncbi:unknown [Eubacterium sp. CAG:786]|nr:unknown [Eubacterium sp. CAG:786]
MTAADDSALPAESCRNSVGNYVVDFRMFLSVDYSAHFSALDYRARHAVRKVLLDACGSPEHLFLGIPVEGNDLFKHRLCIRERARLVENDGIRRGKGFKVLSALDRDVVVYSLTQR